MYELRQSRAGTLLCRCSASEQRPSQAPSPKQAAQHKRHSRAPGAAPRPPRPSTHPRTATPGPPPQDSPNPFTSPLLARLHELLSEYEAGRLQPGQRGGLVSAGLSEAGLHSGLSQLAATAPNQYDALLRATAASIQPKPSQLPPPYAAIAGEDTARTRPTAQTGPKPHTLTSSATLNDLAPAVTDLAKGLAALVGVPADSLLQGAQDETASALALLQAAQPAQGLAPSSGVGAPGSGLASVSGSQVVGPDERTIVAEYLQEMNSAGEPPVGSVERALWDKAVAEEQCVSLHVAPHTVPGWVDSPHVYPAARSFLPWEVFLKGRQLPLPPLRWPHAQGTSSTRGTRVGRVVWVLKSYEDIQALAHLTANTDRLVRGLVGWRGTDPIDCIGPLTTPAPPHTASATHTDTVAATGQRTPGKGTTTDASNEGLANQPVGQLRSHSVSAAAESSMAHAVRAGVQSVWLTLLGTYLDTMELHVYAPSDLLHSTIGTTAIRRGASHMDLYHHATAHDARRRRLSRRRRREMRLFQRAQATRAAAKSARGAPAAPQSPAAAVIAAWDVLDGWAEYYQTLDPDYPTALRGIPEKDLIYAVQYGRLPPRYRRLAVQNKDRNSHSSPVAKAGTRGVLSLTGPRGTGGFDGGIGGEGGGGGEGEGDLELRVLGALADLKQRVAMPWCDSPGLPTLEPITLLQLLVSLGAVPHACATEQGMEDRDGPTMGPCEAAALQDIQVFGRMAARLTHAHTSSNKPPRLGLVLLTSNPTLVTAVQQSALPAQVARLLVSDDPSCVQLANDSQHQVPGGYTLTLSYEGLFSGAYLTGSGSRSGTDTHTDTSQYRNQSDTEQLQMQAQR